MVPKSSNFHSKSTIKSQNWWRSFQNWPNLLKFIRFPSWISKYVSKLVKTVAELAKIVPKSFRELTYQSRDDMNCYVMKLKWIQFKKMVKKRLGFEITGGDCGGPDALDTAPVSEHPQRGDIICIWLVCCLFWILILVESIGVRLFLWGHDHSFDSLWLLYISYWKNNKSRL